MSKIIYYTKVFKWWKIHWNFATSYRIDIKTENGHNEPYSNIKETFLMSFLDVLGLTSKVFKMVKLCAAKLSAALELGLQAFS